MDVGDRITYAMIGALFGVLMGVACWWLYGLAYSVNFPGPGLDPVLRHWVTYLGAVFAALGFFFRARVGDFLADALSAMFHFEAGDTPGSPVSLVFAVAFLALVIAAVRFSVPT